MSFQYEDGAEVVLWMNTVGPYHNRQETYNYFSLPFCVGNKPTISHYHETLSEALQVLLFFFFLLTRPWGLIKLRLMNHFQGVELEFSGLDIDFKIDVPETLFCETELTEEKLKAFVYAVKNHYWYQMYIDDLPVWGMYNQSQDFLF